MPLLFPPGTRVSDADGNPLNDAQVRVRLANTMTLATLYSDAALSVPLSNPVITNAEGYPTSDGSNETLIWIASGDYDTAFLTSGGSVLVSWPDVPTFGEEAGDFDRTVAGNARVKITGSAGTVLIQVGDPSPDNTGGTLTISGWAGTQADSVTVNSALLNVVGALTVNSKKLTGVVYAESTFSAATVIIALPNVPAGVTGWRIIISDLIFSVSLSLQINLSYDGGGAYKTGAGDYSYNNSNGLSSAGAVTSVIGDGSNTTAANVPALMEMTVFTPDSGAHATSIQGIISMYEAGSPIMNHFVVNGLNSYGRCTHLKLLGVGGTLTGRYRVEPLYGTGDA